MMYYIIDSGRAIVIFLLYAKLMKRLLTILSARFT